MEALTDLPELEAKIEGGELTLANLSQVQIVTLDAETVAPENHLSPGGRNSRRHELSNLRLRCRSHNLWAAIQVFGKDRMGRYLKS